MVSLIVLAAPAKKTMKLKRSRMWNALCHLAWNMKSGFSQRCRRLQKLCGISGGWVSGARSRWLRVHWGTSVLCCAPHGATGTRWLWVLCYGHPAFASCRSFSWSSSKSTSSLPGFPGVQNSGGGIQRAQVISQHGSCDWGVNKAQGHH